MNGMMVTEMAHLAEQEHMRNFLMAQERRAERRRRWRETVRKNLRSLVSLGSNRQGRTTHQVPPPAILSPGIRREAR